MTTPITGTSGSAAPSTTTSATGFDKDMFMKLLVAQLKFQNPMQPADSNAYMQQMAVFAQVEKMGQLVDSQTASQAAQQRLSAEALMGMKVTGTDADGDLKTGVVDGLTLNGPTPLLMLDDGSTVSLTTLTKVERPATP